MSMSPKPMEHILVLPRNRSPAAFITSFVHSRTATPSRYLVDPINGIYEFNRVSVPQNACRSWMLTSSTGVTSPNDGQESSVDGNEHGHSAEKFTSQASSTVLSKPDLLVATPVDPIFLLIPVLHELSAKEAHSRALYLSCDDILDKICEKSIQFEHVVKAEPLRAMFGNRLPAICDSVKAGDESMYRLSETKLLAVLLEKATGLANMGLPASLEDRFVKRALDVPMLGVRRENSSISEDRIVDTVNASAASSIDSETPSLASDSSLSATSQTTDITIPEDNATEEEIQRLLCIRTILSYITSSYLPSALATTVMGLFGSGASPIDFTPLDNRLAHISKLRTEALAARSLGDFSRKRNAYEDDEVAEARLEKKRKKEEEEKRKKLETRGVRDLKKVDITGMRKMSDFFRKKAIVKK